MGLSPRAAPQTWQSQASLLEPMAVSSKSGAALSFRFILPGEVPICRILHEERPRCWWASLRSARSARLAMLGWHGNQDRAYYCLCAWRDHNTKFQGTHVRVALVAIPGLHCKYSMPASPLIGSVSRKGSFLGYPRTPKKI